MTKYFVSRHAGATAWARGHGLPDVTVVDHFGDDILAALEEKDVVIGTLPVNLVAAINRKGVRYFHLTLDLPANARGRDLSLEEMARYGARLEEYAARRLD